MQVSKSESEAEVLIADLNHLQRKLLIPNASKTASLSLYMNMLLCSNKPYAKIS